MADIPPITPERDKLLNLSKVLLGAFLIVGASLVFWGAIRADSLLARNDNPRGLEAELRIQRGAVIDRSGMTLALNEGSSNEQQRRYPLPAGGHLVGYYSLLHGTSGTEAGFDFDLRGETGDFWAEQVRQTLHLPQTGRDVQLALDYAIQETAEEALGDKDGGALLLELPRDGENRAWIRAMASLPGYDANQLDETFEELGAAVDAPLLNRITQGQYQPGMLLQPFILASSIDAGIMQLGDLVEEAEQPVPVNGTELGCAGTPPDPATWADVLQYRCPAPMQALADRVGPGGLDVAFSAFGFDRDPILEIDTETTPGQPLADPLLAAVGQENLSVTPLQIGLAMAALAADGSLPQAQVGSAIADEQGEWQPWFVEGEIAQATAPATARALRRALPQENGVYEVSPLVLSGPQGSTNAWYVGIWPGEESDYVAVVVLEEGASEGEAAASGRAILEMVQP